MTGAVVYIPYGIDAYQRTAREAAGIETRTKPAKVIEKLVCHLVAYECEACGCTNAWPADAKAAAKVCTFCGTKHQPIRIPGAVDRLWVKGFDE